MTKTMHDDTIMYQDKNVNIKTVYTIEYIDNKKDFERIDTHPAAWELYKTIKTESFQDAISKYITLYSRQYSNENELYHVYDVKMFENTLLNDETIREKCITNIFNFNGILNNHAGIIERNIQELNKTIETVSNELNTVYAFLDKYNGMKEYKKYKEELKNN